ncbi:MAG: DUF5131 family protein [Alphaproteobacteria bacterium]
MEERMINDLKPHLINERIYKDTYDHSLIKSIEEYGLRGTVEITKDDVIISGHRRWHVCQELGYETIPVTVLDETDPDKLIEYLIRMNQASRLRTNEQIAREFDVLMEIENKRAKERQGERIDLKPNIKENFPESKKDTGQSRDIAAEKLNTGWSGRTAETASKVVEYADEIETEEPEIAQVIKDTLNTKSVHAANKVVIEHKKPKQSIKTMNATNDNIEWAKWSWNPITGCKFGCKYCYAKDIAMRFDGHFNPTFHKDRLSAPSNTTIPKQKTNEIGIKNVFVCSMADLFGDWVNSEWIQSVIDICEDQNQWKYLFLTKNPGRYLDFDFSKNCWLGASATNQRQFNKAMSTFALMKSDNIRFISFEPLNEVINTGIETFEGKPFDWMIIGGRSKNSKMPAFQPEWEWVEHLLLYARAENIPVYFKPNLIVRPKEYPHEI